MGGENSQFTSYMQSVVDGVMDRIKSFYCREDVERKLEEVMVQHRKKQSGYYSRLRELNEMCSACGIDAALLCDEDSSEAELEKVLPRRELRRELITELHNIYLEFPTSGMFMERLVRRLLRGEFASDSLRLAILKKLVRDTDYQTQSIISLVEGRLGDADRAAYARAKGEEKRGIIVRNLDDGIFALLDSGVDPQSHLNFLLKHIKADEPGKFKLSESLKERIGGEGDAAARLSALEARITEPGAGDLVEAAEKEFCAYLKQFTYTKKKAKDPKKAQGTKDEVYRQAKKDFLKPMKKALTLLKLADDLAAGKFRVNGATKEQLYIFAVAFDMRTGAAAESWRDVEKNLFHDYYNDNLLRYVLDEEYIRNNTNYETEPSGEGINYKNYVEVIYLYYLTKYPEMPSREKLKRIQSLIERCAKEAKEHPRRVDAEPEGRTAFFREDYMHSVLAISDENELVEYICSHYYIHNPNFISARISYASGRNTAAEFYREIAQRMLDEYPESFGTMYDNVELPGGVELQRLLDELKEENGSCSHFTRSVLDDGNFIKLLEKLDKKLVIKKRRIMAICEKGEEDKAQCTRTELISLYCSYFRLVLEELTEDYGVMDLPSLYQEFCEGDGIRPGINYYLKESRYQTISPKNAFDMFVVFSLFLDVLSWGE